ncbi:MAG: hypothetical protein EZS28_002430, partial [Streblomastix strix]
MDSVNEEFIIPQLYEDLLKQPDDIHTFMVESASLYEDPADAAQALNNIQNDIINFVPNKIPSHRVFDTLFGLLQQAQYDLLEVSTKNDLAGSLYEGLNALIPLIDSYIMFRRNIIGQPLEDGIGMGEGTLRKKKTQGSTVAASVNFNEMSGQELATVPVRLRNAMKMFIFLIQRLNDLALDEFERTATAQKEEKQGWVGFRGLGRGVKQNKASANRNTDV